MDLNIRLSLSPAVEKLLLARHEELIAAIKQAKGALMATAEQILAKIEANTDVLQSVSDGINALEEGATDIKARIADLKAQIAAGQAPDLTALDAAADKQAAVAAGLRESVPENTGEELPGPSTS